MFGADGNVYLAGYMNLATVGNAFAASYATDGVQNWLTEVTPGTGKTFARAVTYDSGDIILVGSTTGVFTGATGVAQDGFVARLNDEGVVQ